MDKKHTFVLVSVLIIALALVGIILFNSKKTDSQHQAAEKYKPACMVKDDRIALDADERQNIELVALGELMTVPAGTEVDVNIATHTTSQVTGSAIYPEKYGTYNFTLGRENGDPKKGWAVTKFVTCAQQPKST